MGWQPSCIREDLELDHGFLRDIIVESFILSTRQWDTLPLAQVLPDNVVKDIFEAPIPFNPVTDTTLMWKTSCQIYCFSSLSMLTNTCSLWCLFDVYREV